MKKIQDLLHHLFIPKEKNNYRAKALHHDFLTVYLVFALVVTVLFKQIQTETGNVLGYATDISTQKLYELTNKEREKAGLPLLTYNEKLSKAAQLKGENMFENNYWSHYGSKGESPWQFILGAGYEYEYAGENLAKNFLFSNGVVDAWMNSPSHKENIMRKEYKDIGFAVVNGVLNGEETTLVVQMFGTPSTSVAKAPEEKQEVIQEPALNPQNDIVINQQAKPAVLAKSDTQVGFPFMPALFNFNVLFFLFLLFALILDFYFATRLKIVRINGKNIIHAMFIGAITIGLFIVAKGKII